MLISAAIMTAITVHSSPSLKLPPIMPAPIKVDADAGEGCLQVFSDTETHVLGDNTDYYPHTGYTIHDPSGKQLEYIFNHVGDMDETPTIVGIPAGDYNIVAQSSSYGRITVPVVIQNGRITVVHLDRDWQISTNDENTKIARLPDGEAVGWSN